MMDYINVRQKADE